MMIAVIALVWVASGAASHIYWVRNRYDYTTGDILTSVFASLIGPMAWFIGWSVYGDEHRPSVVFKKRRNNAG